MNCDPYGYLNSAHQNACLIYVSSDTHHDQTSNINTNKHCSICSYSGYRNLTPSDRRTPYKCTQCRN